MAAVKKIKTSKITLTHPRTGSKFEIDNDIMLLDELHNKKAQLPDLTD